MPTPAPILVFDVNDTLLDLGSLEPHFERLLGDRRAMREWFGDLILHAQTLTLCGHYRPFNQLAAAVLRMRAELSGVAVSDADVATLADAMARMPAAADVIPALERLRGAGFRLVTLSNSPPSPSPTPLERAGIAAYFERQFSVDAVRRFKPHPACYLQVAHALAVDPAQLCLVACHGWDTLGARAIGCQAAFFARPGNAPMPLPGLPAADFIAKDLPALVEQLCAARR